MSRTSVVILALAVAVALALLGERSSTLLREESPAGVIRVVERPDGVRELYMGPGRGRQTALHPDRPEVLELPYTRVAMAGLGVVPRDARILFVGLGGGAMPRYVRWLLPRARIQVVELEPRVVEVAREWFGFRTDSLLTVHVADGRDVIQEAEPGSWDLVILDAFSGGEIPPSLTTLEFLEAVRRSLAPQGVAVGNLHTTSRVYRSMLATWQEVFPAVALVDVPLRRQKILLAGPARSVDGDALVQGARALARERDPGFDLPGLVAAEYERLSPVEAPLLRDPP